MPSASLDDEGHRQFTAAIEALDGQGCGVARAAGAKVHIPFTLPGEIVRAESRGAKTEAVAIERASSDRVQPVCRHFGTCGGCSLQHWREAPYAEWKAGLVTSALARAEVHATVEPLKSYPLASRRRATLTARKNAGRLALGYNAARSHDVIDLEECPIMLPGIASALPPLKEALTTALQEASEAKIHVTAAENGLECAIEGPKLMVRGQAKLMQTLLDAGFIRAVWNGEVIFQKAAPFVLCAGVRVALPQGAFLQAVEACERDMASFAGDVLADARAANSPVCDLFAGLGAFSFACARLSPVSAFEENAGAVAALGVAAKEAKGIKPVKAVRRDLFRNPLGPMELNGFAAVVADPPRQGAEAQCRALAQSRIATIVMLSCNPATFARDAAILAAGGFSLTRVAAFDQFKFSAHVEIAAAFRRPGSKKGRLSPALKL